MKKFTIIFGIMLLQVNLFAQWQAESKKDEFLEPTFNYYSIVVNF